MMDRDPIEEVLRRPAPDEPASLRPLGLNGSPTSKVSGTTRAAAGARRIRVASVLLVLVTALVSAVTWQLAAVGETTAPSSPPSTVGPTVAPTTESSGPVMAQMSRFHEAGLSFEYPDSWRLYEIRNRYTGGSTIAVLGTVDLTGCRASGERVDEQCVRTTRLGPDDVLLFVKTAASPAVSIFDLAPPGGFEEFIDGMPAVVQTTEPIESIGQDEGRRWRIGWPGQVTDWYEFVARMRGPGIDRLRDRVDSVVRSPRFDEPAAPMSSDPAAIAAALRRGIDKVDRRARESYHSQFYACFPRTDDAPALATIRDGPGGPLAGPLDVTCSVAIKPTVIGLFEVTLTAMWNAGAGYGAGMYRELLYLDGQGSPVHQTTVTDTPFPETRAVITPGPAKTPIILAPGSLVEVLPPGVFVYMSTDLRDNFNELGPGERLLVIDGPSHVDGESWYRVEWQPNSTYDGIPGWMPSTLDGHPVVAPVAPRCPTAVADVVDLLAIHPAERLGCFGDRPITLGPAILTEYPGRPPATGSPAWLADSATIGMYGRSGPEGVDSPLSVRADPNAMATLPTNIWLEVTGHFDDPASADCRRSWTAEFGLGEYSVAQTTAEQVTTCREQFVITSARPVPAP